MECSCLQGTQLQRKIIPNLPIFSVKIIIISPILFRNISKHKSAPNNYENFVKTDRYLLTIYKNSLPIAILYSPDFGNYAHEQPN